MAVVCLYFAIEARNTAEDALRRLERTAGDWQESREELALLERDLREGLQAGERRLEEAAQTVTANRNRIRTLLETTRSLREELDTVLARLAEPPPVTSGPGTDPGTPDSAAPDSGSAAPPPSPATATPPAAAPAAAEAGTPDGERPPVYRVQRGDTLSDIARRFGISLEALLGANPGLDPNLIQVGQELALPPPGDS